MSPSLSWDHRNMLVAMEMDNAWMKKQRLWIDTGTEEGVAEDYEKHLRLTASFTRSCSVRG